MAVIESYTDSAGLAWWPDAPLDSEKEYAVDWTAYLVAENDTISTVSWTVPTGMTSKDEYEVADEARIKLSADSTGSYEITCEMNSIEGAKTQKHIQVMHIDVV